MTTSGTITVALTANTTEFTNKIKPAHKELDEFNAAALGKGALKGLGFNPAQITAVATGFTAAAEGVRMAVEAGAKVAEVGAEVIRTLVEWTLESAEVIDSAYKMSQALGVTTESFMGLGAAAAKEANTGAEEFAAMMLKMEKSIGAAGSADDLAKLGLKVEDLAKIPADRQFLKIADAISHMKNPMDQVTAATALFGKEGGKLLPLLNQGAKGIQEMADKARDYGVAVSTFDASRIAAMKDQVEELGMQWAGIKNTLAIELAPTIMGILQLTRALIPVANELKADFASWMFYAAGFLDYTTTAADVLVKMHTGDIAGLRASRGNTAFLDFLEKAADLSTKIAKQSSMKPIGATIDADQVSKLKSMKDAVEAVQLQALTAGLDDVNRKIVEFMVKNAAVPGMTKALNDYAAAVHTIAQAAQQKKIGDFLSDMQFKAATAGLTGINLLVAQMKHELQGVSDAQLLTAVNFQVVIDKAKEAQEWTAKIKQTWDDNQTPIEKYLNTLIDINKQIEHGQNLEIAKRALIKANQELLSAYRRNEPGITDARTTRFNLLPAIPAKRDPVADLAAALKAAENLERQQLKEAQKTNQILKENGWDVVTIEQLEG